MGKREDEYNLKSQGDFKKYIDKIFEHDIARAGLAIALHNLNPKEGEAHNIFPIKFGKSPLLFLLILCDELQEYIRPEGISIRPITKLKKLPKLEVEVVTNNDQIDINVEVKLCYPKEINKEKEVILKQAETYYRPYRGLSITDADFQSLDTFLAWYWRQTTDRIKKKLSFQRENNVRIKFKLSVNKEEETGTVEEIHHFRK